MTTLPTAATLAVLVVLSGIAGVVAADPTDVSPTATPTAVETTPTEDAASERATVPPDRDASFEQRLAGRLSQFDLTDEQVRTVVTEAVRLREAGASRLVVRSSIVMQLYEYGVDAPFLYVDGGGATAGERLAERLGERFDLTEAQVDEVAATIDRMRADGASRAEIYRTVRGLLVEYGVGEDALEALDRRAKHSRAHHLHERAHRHHQRAHELHERAHRHHQRAHELHERAHRLRHVAAQDDVRAGSDAVDRRVDRLQSHYGLTDRQAATLERLVRGMFADGADRGDVADAVRAQLAEWGIDRPAAASERRDGSRSGADRSTDR